MLNISGSGGEELINQLLKLLADPAAVKQAIAELRLASDKAIADQQLAANAQSEAKNQIAAAREQIGLAEAAATKASKAEDDLDATVRLLAAREAKAKNRESELDATLDAANADILAREQTLAISVRNQAIAESQAMERLREREDNVALREAQVASISATATSMRDEYEKKLRALKAIAA